jgi:hypothetical protein
MLDFLRDHLDAQALLEFLRTNLGALYGIAAALISAAAASVIIGQVMRARRDRQIGPLIQSFANQSKGWNWVAQELEGLERNLMTRALPSDDLRAVGDKLRPLLAENSANG